MAESKPKPAPPAGEMTPRERIRATVKGQPVDHVPYFIWLNPHAACKIMAEYRPSRNRWINTLGRFAWNRFVRNGEFDAPRIWRAMPLLLDYHSFNYADEYALELGSDVLLAVAATPWHFAKINLPSLFFGERFMMQDMFGTEIALGGIYPDLFQPAIKDIEALKTYRLPDPGKTSCYDIFRRYRRRFPGHSIATEVFGPEDFPANFLLGFQKYMLYLTQYPEEMKAFLSKWTDYQVAVLVNSVRAGADIALIGDDYGYDHAIFLSPRMWKTFIYPGLKRLIDAAHEEGALTMLHSCGYQMKHLQFYVEAGLDMLQAFQPKAGNDFAKAYAEFGGRLTFVTGIDIQQGERMTPDQLQADILRSYQIGGRNGRHVLATSHELQYTMPLANMRAIFETLDGIRQGVHDQAEKSGP
jgi:uroporphyrinogen-III decarboxylase